MAKETKRPGQGTRIAGIRMLATGLYLVRARGVTSDGRRVERERRVQAPSLKEAERMRARLEDEIRGSVAAEHAERSTLGALAEAWLARKLEARRPDGSHRLAPTTRQRLTHSVRGLIVPMLGATPADKIDRRLVERWRDHLGGVYRGGTANQHVRVLREMLRDADIRAADGVRPLPQDDSQITDDEPNCLDEDELGRFLASARQLYPEHWALISVLLTTGGRISTVLALRVEDIDTERRTITFRRRLSMGEILPGAKRSRSARDVAPLLDGVEAELRKLWATYTEAQRESGLVFCGRDGAFLSRLVLRVPFRRILADAGIRKRFTVHGCRRVSATLYRQAAGSAVAKAVLGHLTDAQHEHYSRVSTAEKHAAARAAFRVLDGGSQGGIKGTG